MDIRPAHDTDLPTLIELAAELWPGSAVEALTAEYRQLITSSEARFFLAEEGGSAIGFAHCQLRRDYVEGTDSSPVGYLEGIYVQKAWRCQGVASQLLIACEMWARGRGCSEFASDCELANEASRRFHLRVGFAEAGRIIHFAKKLSERSR